MLEYRLGSREYRVRVDLSDYPRYPLLKRYLETMFPQVEPDTGFLDRVSIRDMGRIRVAGRPAERVRLSPNGYKGDSLELWVEPKEGYTLGWRRLDPRGRLIRGYRYRSVTGFQSSDGPGRSEEPFRISPFFADRKLMPVEEVREFIDANPAMVLPEWLPDGFRMVGGRKSGGSGPSMDFEGMLPGTGLGGFRKGPQGPMAGAGHFQVVYSDGLNTISVIQFPRQRLTEAGFDPGAIDQALKSKSKQVESIFHTSMATRAFPNSIVIVLGEVAPELVRRVADSIPKPPEDAGPGIMPPPPMGNGDRPLDRPPGGDEWRGRFRGGDQPPPPDQGE